MRADSNVPPSGSTIDSPTFTGAIKGVPFILGASGIPIIVPSSGTMGNNGALSAITALGRTYAKCYMFFAANVIASGVAAGFYYTEMSSTTAGTVFNNLIAATGNPELPASKTAFVTTGPGAFTGSTSTQTPITLPYTGGMLGANGRLELDCSAAATSNANGKSVVFAIGASSLTISCASNGQAGIRASIHNVGDQAVQSMDYTLGVSTPGQPIVTAGTVDTSANANVTIGLVHGGAATDNIVLEKFIVRISYSA